MDTIKELWATVSVYVWLAVVVVAGWVGFHIAADQDPKVGSVSWNPLDVALDMLKGRFRMPENGIVFTIGAIIVAVVILMVLWFAVPAICSVRPVEAEGRGGLRRRAAAAGPRRDRLQGRDHRSVRVRRGTPDPCDDRGRGHRRRTAPIG